MRGFSVDVIIWTVLSLSIQYSESTMCRSSDDCVPGEWCDTVVEKCEGCYTRDCTGISPECQRVCLGLLTMSPKAESPSPTVSEPPVEWPLLLCIVVITCLFVVAAALTAFVVYRYACARRDRSAVNRDAEKPFLRQTSNCTRASESSTSSDRDATCCMPLPGPRDDGKSNGGVTINNVVTMSANVGNGKGGQVVEPEWQKPSFYLQQEPPVILPAKA